MLSYWGVNELSPGHQEHKEKYVVATVFLWDIRRLKFNTIMKFKACN